MTTVELSAFSNRLKKNFKHLSKWARRNGIGAWRVYDRDIPQFPVSVDVYGSRAYIAEFDTGWQMEDDVYEVWRTDLIQTVSDVLEIAVDAIAFRTRRRQKGLNQYEKLAHYGQNFVIEEQGASFVVNLEKYLDTGLFLDHRNTRARVRDEAKGKRFLNLFAYTGSFTVYAAQGGALCSETIDLSNTYQDWSRRNFELNQMDLTHHRLIRDDVFHYLGEAKEQGKTFDLIVMDPPSFSNSKKMLDTLDIQRDQIRLINGAMQLLSPDGVMYFSNNLRSFSLHPMLEQAHRVENISHQSVPEDFRNKKIHQCWRFQHRQSD